MNKWPGFLCAILAALQVAAQDSPARIDSLQTRLATESSDTNTILLMVQLCDAYSFSAPDTGIWWGKRALARAEALDWRRGIGKACNFISKCYWNKSEYSQAIRTLNQALALHTADRNAKDKGAVFSNMAMLYQYAGNPSKALEYGFLALKEAEASNDDNTIAHCMMHIGSVYESIGQFGKAKQYHEQSLRLFQKLGDRTSAAVCFGNIANVLYRTEDYQGAIRYQRRELAEDQAVGNTEGIMRGNFTTGLIYQKQHIADSAFFYFFSVLKLAKETSYQIGEGMAARSVGETLLALANDRNGRKPGKAVLQQYRLPSEPSAQVRAAIGYLRQAAAVHTGMGVFNELQTDYALLADAYKTAGNPAAAQESRLKFYEIRDSLQTAEGRIKIANLESERELQLKDKQIELDRLAVAKKRNERVLFGAAFALFLLSAFIVLRNLRLKNAKQLSESQLTALRAQMNPHFVFNSLNSIQECIVTAKYSEASRYLNRFAKLFRMLLHNSARPVITLAEEIEVLEQYLALEHMRFDRTFDYHIDIDPELEPSEIRIPSMLLQPFVENALWHGLMHKEGPRELSIAFDPLGEDRFRCTIADNGIGREQAAAMKAARSTGARHESMGMKITADRLTLLQRQGHKAAIRIEDRRQPDGGAAGTTVVVELSANFTAASTTA